MKLKHKYNIGDIVEFSGVYREGRPHKGIVKEHFYDPEQHKIGASPYGYVIVDMITRKKIATVTEGALK